METYSEETVRGFGRIVQDESAPLKRRFRALFALRAIACDYSVREIAHSFNTTSILLKHELAYVLGQMQNRTALPVLVNLLINPEENEIVRHEAAEAIATFGDPLYLDLLNKYANESVSGSKAVSETCEIGAALIKRGGSIESVYGSLDPALSSGENSIDALEKVYLDVKQPLSDRYSAMFKLRDIGTEDAVNVIGKGFELEKKSDLFEHEIAFVFGQMAHPASVKYLVAALSDNTKHEMVRHEAAEALGCIPTEEARKALLAHKNTSNRIVRESIEIGLDIQDYVFSDSALEYAMSQLEKASTS